MIQIDEQSKEPIEKAEKGKLNEDLPYEIVFDLEEASTVKRG